MLEDVQMTADIEIDGIEEGYLVTTRYPFSTKREYVPTLGQALAKVIYRMLRLEADMPEPHNEGYKSETLQTIMMLLKSFGPKAVDKALADNLKDFAKVPKPVIAEDGSHDI